MNPQIIEVKDRWDDGVYYRCVTSDPDEINELKRLANLAGLVINVHRVNNVGRTCDWLKEVAG